MVPLFLSLPITYPPPNLSLFFLSSSLSFQGANIVDSMLEWLISDFNLDSLSHEIVLTGCSAGGTWEKKEEEKGEEGM